MKFLSSDDVSEPLYSFIQMACGSDSKKINSVAFSFESADRLFDRFGMGVVLPIKEAISLPMSERRALLEICSQYLIFLTMNRDLPFALDFLDGTTDLQLGGNLLRYFAEHQFPFPQRLPQ